jgi:prepilin-type processing-associated H-X9-DG protein/prepilin-type N-terminal cleavage/methylation domain-containing protein
MKLRSPHRRRHRGFTLVELLTVFSIIAIMASLLYGAVKNMQHSARTASCMNNLRSLGAAFRLYAADNEGLLPAMRYRSDLAGDNPTKKNWQFELNPYLQLNGTSFKALADSASGASRAVFCAEYYMEYKESKDAQKLISGGYGMNANLGGSTSGWDFRPSVVSIPAPVQTILAGDSDDYHISVKAGTWPSEAPQDQRFGTGDPLRHSKGANYLFVDGHAEMLTLKEAETALTSTKAQ